MVLLKNFYNMFFIAELRKKILFTLGVLVIYRLGSYIPVIGVNVPLLGEYMSQKTGLAGFLGYLDIFSGGSLERSTIFALGIGPYITASIMMQMLGMTIPSLEQLLKEGEYGRKIINQYTRYLTLVLSVMYSLGFALALENQGLALVPGFGFRALFVLTMSVGTLFVMWLGEQISLFGLGNGSSMIIFAGIVSRFPDHVLRTLGAVFDTGEFAGWKAFAILLAFLAITMCIIFVEKGERKIPVQYARRVIGQRVYGGQSTYIPFKINMPGVMPVIFASAVLNIPMTLSTVLASRFAIFENMKDMLTYGGFTYSSLEFLLIIFFSFFYTALIFNPEELAENIKKSGGFIPGIRPGKKTAEFFYYILTRIGLIGAIYLGCLAVAPNILHWLFERMPFYLGGTSLLIVVGVALEASAQIESYLIEHKYEGFLTTGKFKGRAGR